MLQALARRKTALVSFMLLVAVIAGGFWAFPPAKTDAAASYDAVIYFPFNRYPLTGDHIRDAIAAGESAICTIDRAGADQNRKESLAGIPTKSGHDRDEWPMAMCAEGGYGADVRYVPSSDNRGAGAWVGNQLSKYANGKRIKFVMSYE
ncbi:NucA/NucB deoxyribonuclease domain-containing protein [Paenibacillus methanolicus]|uniref:Deoxyribonuclease NucA/NucB n=1 Tax=Paenibacillus methanolicus TaxID=582686 RepID=A0A5S5BX54_9BACL|nr:NucA/NucB deoxyribonuclease domain-containing protein [Paenibacillus methanolicus]TYP70213.1 deoxyribonuclease NucA/NucB [Paenibacillus methanolicus]